MCVCRVFIEKSKNKYFFYCFIVSFFQGGKAKFSSETQQFLNQGRPKINELTKNIPEKNSLLFKNIV